MLEKISSSAEGESAEWLNTMIKQLWPYINEFAKTLMIETIQPILNESVPGALGPLVFKKASLGDSPPRIQQVIVHTRRHDSMLLDMDIEFVGNPDISLTFAKGMITAGVESMKISGRLCVLLKPLVNTMPLVGAVQAAFINQPKLELNYSGIGNVGDFGMIKKIVQNTVDTVLASMLVYPNHLLVKLSETVNFFNTFHQPEGLLRITIPEARGFKSSGFSLLKDVPDPYVKFMIGGEEFTTETANNQEAPKFNAKKEFLLFDTRQDMTIGIYDNDMGSDQKYGEVVLPVKSILETGDQWLTVGSEKDSVRPQVRVTAKILPFVAEKQTQENFVPGEKNVLLVVSIDRAVGIKENEYSQVKVTVGKHTKSSTTFASGLNVDTTRPIFNSDLLFLLENLSGLSTVDFDLLVNGKSSGKHSLALASCHEDPNLTCSGTFELVGSQAPGATITAMVRVLYVKQ